MSHVSAGRDLPDRCNVVQSGCVLHKVVFHSPTSAEKERNRRVGRRREEQRTKENKGKTGRKRK